MNIDIQRQTIPLMYIKKLNIYNNTIQSQFKIENTYYAYK